MSAVMRTRKTGVEFRIDAEDSASVRRYSWRIDGEGYPSATINRTAVRLHVFLMGPAPAGLVWDHENRDKLDNRRANLRAVTKRVNAMNSGLRRNNRSGARNVYWSQARRLWVAQVRRDGRTRNLGGFQSVAEAEAALRGIE